MPSMTDTIPAARPVEPFADLKARAAAAVEDARDEIIDLLHRIHANPEPAFEEHQASAWVAEVIARHGYAVERPVGSLDTAVRGRLTGLGPTTAAAIAASPLPHSTPGIPSASGISRTSGTLRSAGPAGVVAVEAAAALAGIGPGIGTYSPAVRSAATSPAISASVVPPSSGLARSLTCLRAAGGRPHRARTT